MDDQVSNPYSRHPHPSHALVNQDTASLSSSASSHSRMPPSTTMLTVATPSRPYGLPTQTLPHPNVARSPGSIGAYSHSYATSSTSLGTVTGGLPDHLSPTETGVSTAGISPTHITASSISAQKRAYRQRRKDPSCDACRERKVKCDATEMSSCSECSSRSVKCQFTKETNRRMSSIKQVQDLQSQLGEAKQQIQHLRSMLQEVGVTDIDRRPVDIPSLKLPDISPNHEKRHAPPVISNFDHVRKNIRIYGRGIFKAPPPYRQIASQPAVSSPVPALPPMHITERLMNQYHNTVHVFCPLLHWPTFLSDVDRVYSAMTFHGAPHIWVSLFFAVLACGTLQTFENTPNAPRPENEGFQYLELATRTINMMTDELTMDHARTALLMSIFTTEMNMKSAGWVWLGSAVRIAQDIGLHCETGPWPFVETEVRRRVWWAIYAWDRLLSLEVGRPLLIDDEDCQNVGWPCPVDDHYIQPQGIVGPPTGHVAHGGLAAVIPVVRFISQLKRTLKARTVAPGTLQTYDDYFRAVMTSFPEEYQITNESYLDPLSLPSALVLQMARFHLYRHNLSITCHPATRIDALNRCVSVAQDTVKYITRTGPPDCSDPASGPAQGWHARIASSASSILSTHLWRCILVLCFRAEYGAALRCVRVGSAIGDLRKVNIACGRNLAFFLDRLAERVHSGHGSQQQLEVDEEMLAYVSGDMQGCTENSWVWTGSETGIKLNANPTYPPASDTSARENGETSEGAFAMPRQGVLLPEKESRECGVWERVERMICQLMDDQQARLTQNTTLYHTPPHDSGKKIHLAPPDALATGGPNGATTSGVSPGNSSSRISIANII